MCSNPFQTTSDLRNHLTAVHRVNDPKGFICVYCEKSFTKKFNMQRHMKLVHKVDVQAKIDLTEVESECRIEGNSNDLIEAKKKIEVSVILENIRNDMLSRENLSRIHLTTRQDIKNIKRSFDLTNQRHADDATSVRLMLEEMAEFGTDNPILGCKFQGCLYYLSMKGYK
ncbi:c2H2-type domain-containing protein [Trichonephila clavipes]|nr:c2H2-type domain-containing protein [Trichonephila clavipes]